MRSRPATPATAALAIGAFPIWAILTPADARSSMKAAVDWIASNLGWYYVLTMTPVIGFVLWVAFSREGSVRLGPGHSRPQYPLVTWVAMLFAAGVGIDMLFHSVTGPVVQFLQPPSGGFSLIFGLEQGLALQNLGGYDLMGLTKQQVIDDVLERYEAHLAFRTVSTEPDSASVLTPPMMPRDQPSTAPKDGEDVQDLERGKE